MPWSRTSKARHIGDFVKEAWGVRKGAGASGRYGSRIRKRGRPRKVVIRVHQTPIDSGS